MKWFFTQVDRYFNTRRYGDGVRLYTSNSSYTLITGESYTEEVLKVKDKAGNVITLTDEPDIEMFEILHWQ